MATIESITRNVYGSQGSFIALITGEDPKYGLARSWVSKRDVTKARSNTYREIEWTLTLEEGQVYEYKFLRSSRAIDQGYWFVRNGQREPISRAQAEGYVKGFAVRS